MPTTRWIVLSVAFWGASAPLIADEVKKPSFLFIYTDDQRHDAMSVVQREQGGRGRFPWLRTPNLDRLAAEGVRFRNAFVVNALCAPSRASFLTGRYGHLNGVVNNHTPFPEASATHASLLRQAGYATGYVGKWHMGAQQGQRPGFDYSASFVGQGKYFDCPFEINGTSTPTSGWVDDVSTAFAEDFIRKHRDNPFLLVIGFKTAHGPFDPPPRHADTYAGEQARTVPNLAVPAIYRQDGAGGRRPGARGPAGTGLVPANLGYFRALTAMDENVGKLLALLDELELADDTMVVFASDNGYYFGEHGLGDKRSAYEESLRIPLLVRYPARLKAGTQVDRIALNVDLAPTLLDYAGLPVPSEMQGRSWRPLLEGRSPEDWRRSFFYAYFFERGFRIPTVTAVRTDAAKLIRYPGHEEWTELFDLAADPYETRNLASDPAAAALRKQLEAEYEAQAAAIQFRIPDFADDPRQEGAEAGRRAARAANAWVLEYRFDRDHGDEVVDASGRDNHGRAIEAPLVERPGGGKARRFDGKAHIVVPRSPSLDPSVGAWAVEAEILAEAPNGLILARGGRTHGYALHLEGGKPVWTVTSSGTTTSVRGPSPVTGDWVRLTGSIASDRRLVLMVDGREVASGRLESLIPTDPNDGMEIGADRGSPVLEPGAAAGDPPGGFVGQIGSVRIYSGAAPGRVEADR